MTASTVISCHPAYDPCLPLTPGDGLDCDDLAPGVAPVVIWDPSDDPYLLGDGSSRLACGSTDEPSAATTAPAPEAADGSQQSEPLDAAADATTTAQERDIPNESEAAAAPPRPGVGGTTEQTTSPPLTFDVTNGDARQVDDGTQSLSPPPTGAAPRLLPTSEDFNRETPCGSNQPSAGKRDCQPPAADDTIRLWACGTDNRAATSADFHILLDSGVTERTVTRPLRLQVGSRIEIGNTCEKGGLEVLVVVTGFGGPRERIAPWTDEVHGIYACHERRNYKYDDPNAEPVTRRREVLYNATLDADGRYRLHADPARHVGDC